MVKDVEEQPYATLTNWMIVRTLDSNQHHFFGMKSENRWRITSPVVSLDLASMTGQTSSGRHYHLHGRPELDARYLKFAVAKSWPNIRAEDLANVSPEDAALAISAAGNA